MKTSISPGVRSIRARYRIAATLLLAGLCMAQAAPAAAQARATAAPSPTRAQALEIAKIRGLIERQRPRDAIAAAEDALKRFPGNTQIRFLQGVALTDAGRPQDAISAFEALVKDHPELAEPYNNLAVLHASQGNLGAARDALEQSVRVVPDYGLAYENLGDLYLRMAQEAYERAASVTKPSPDARRKLSLARSLSEKINTP
ncbi:MAG: tetratricopeptide repeat protein [Burkholderiaceae bacterium]